MLTGIVSIGVAGGAYVVAFLQPATSDAECTAGIPMIPPCCNAVAGAACSSLLLALWHS